jgi:hypothetical protein
LERAERAVKKQYTVVLLRETTSFDGSPLDAHTVEVYGNNPTKAIRAALDEIKEDPGDDCRPLAVFEGHHRNVIVEAPAFCH